MSKDGSHNSNELIIEVEGLLNSDKNFDEINVNLKKTKQSQSSFSTTTLSNDTHYCKINGILKRWLMVNGSVLFLLGLTGGLIVLGDWLTDFHVLSSILRSIYEVNDSKDETRWLNVFIEKDSPIYLQFFQRTAEVNLTCNFFWLFGEGISHVKKRLSDFYENKELEAAFRNAESQFS